MCVLCFFFVCEKEVSTRDHTRNSGKKTETSLKRKRSVFLLCVVLELLITT